jgi:hypothetical protein
VRYTNIKTKGLYTFPLNIQYPHSAFCGSVYFCVHLCHTLRTKFYSNLSGTEFVENGTKETPTSSVAEGQISNTWRFIMFSMITNIYNKKTKETTLMELFTATGKLKDFWQLEMFNLCTTGDTAHIDKIFQVLATHASTWVHRYSSLLQWSVPKGTDHCSSVWQELEYRIDVCRVTRGAKI